MDGVCAIFAVGVCGLVHRIRCGVVAKIPRAFQHFVVRLVGKRDGSSVDGVGEINGSVFDFLEVVGDVISNIAAGHNSSCE